MIVCLSKYIVFITICFHSTMAVAAAVMSWHIFGTVSLFYLEGSHDHLVCLYIWDKSCHMHIELTVHTFIGGLIIYIHNHQVYRFMMHVLSPIDTIAYPKLSFPSADFINSVSTQYGGSLPSHYVSLSHRYHSDYCLPDNLLPQL